MKKINLIPVIFLFILAACGGNKQSGNPDDAFITVDVTAGYPQKELILQDFMDVEYIPLETNNEFLCEGFVQDIGKNIMLVKNSKNNGDIFVYDRTGKALKKINRMGKGPEEYTYVLGITLDEDNNEMFVNDHVPKKVVVYDLDGNFKRSFKHREGNGSLFYTEIFNYDKDHLICYDQYNKEIPFVLISKQDGSITKEIKIPFKEKVHLQQMRQDGETSYAISPGPYRSISPCDGHWMLSELSSDTAYIFLPDYSLRPFVVRTPPIQSMNPGVFLMLRLFSDRYIFMETIKNEYDFDARKGFPRAFFMYDRQEKAFFGYKIYNGDYSTKKEIYMNVLIPVSHEIESCQRINADDLLESLEKGHLKGKLKEVAEGLDEESNPVIMLVKHKK